jgi:uncharacterized protein (TIGR01777 family)
MRVFVTGATGFIGRRLVERLSARGDDVVALARDRARAGARLPASVAVAAGDIVERGPWLDEAAACDAIVHLAGEPVVGVRWTDARKALMRESRVAGTRNVAAALRAGRARVLVSASAVGYYGAGDAPVDEASPPGGDFLARLACDWEAEAARAGDGDHRVTCVRLGIVLGGEGGVLSRMAPAFRAFVGGPVGSGAQWVSWIHRDDVIGLVELALGDARAAGPLNAVAPEPVTMRELAAGLGRALGRPSWLPAPAFALRALFGEGAGPILTGQRVVPRRALELGYRFRFPSLASALGDLYPNQSAAR